MANLEYCPLVIFIFTLSITLVSSFSGMFRRFLRCYSTLTKDRFPEIKRGNYAVLQDADVSFFEKVLGKNQIITDADEVSSYNKDWLNTVCGTSFFFVHYKCNL